MPAHGLSPDTRLSVQLDAICARNQFTSDPSPVVAELIKTAGSRSDVLAESVGTWVGYFEDDHTLTLCAALRELPDVTPWITIGEERRHTLVHGTPSILGHGKFRDSSR